jgi:hypothetical protein
MRLGFVNTCTCFLCRCFQLFCFLPQPLLAGCEVMQYAQSAVSSADVQ